MNYAIILAAGSSQRFKQKSSVKDKLLVPILGWPVIYHTLVAYHEHPQIDGICLVVSKKNQTEMKKLLKEAHLPRVMNVVLGGAERRDSLTVGLKALKKAKPDDIILIHNGANPLVTEDEITQTISSAQKSGAAAVGAKIHDTIKEIDKGRYTKTHDRTKLIAAQTPQAAKYELLNGALKMATKKKQFFTDESSLLEAAGHKVQHVSASAYNFKITTDHDYERAKIIFGDTPKNFYVGLGQDSHAFSEKKKGLMLGGMLLKDEPKLDADSDGDVVIHALGNALLQAMGEGSLGRIATPMFKEKGIKNSAEYLRTILKKVEKKGLHLHHIGIMIEAKRPPVDPITARIKTSLAKLTGLPKQRVGLTATSGDGLTSFGQGKGVQCFAIVSLKQD